MKFREDPIPQIRPGGFKTRGSEVSAAHCIAPASFDFEEEVDKPRTPEKLKKYRKSHTGQPGFRSVHPGLVEDSENLNRNAAYGYGKSTFSSMHVGQVI